MLYQLLLSNYHLKLRINLEYLIMRLINKRYWACIEFASQPPKLLFCFAEVIDWSVGWKLYWIMSQTWKKPIQKTDCKLHMQLWCSALKWAEWLSDYSLNQEIVRWCLSQLLRWHHCTSEKADMSNILEKLCYYRVIDQHTPSRYCR